MFDLARKLFLASLVLFIDQETGSSKLLRLVVATVVSALFLAALALARPFKRSDDLYLACVANLLLTCCFCLGTVIQLCGEDNDQCYQLVGLNDARRASEFVIGLTAAMLVASLTIIILKAVTAVTAPTLRLAATGRAPILELPSGCHFHGFISHAWGTGQDQTHTVVRQLQLLMPGVKIWLDVDNLDDVGKLEESVADAMTFMRGPPTPPERTREHPKETRESCEGHVTRPRAAALRSTASASRLEDDTSTTRPRRVHDTAPQVLLWLALHLCLEDTLRTAQAAEGRVGAAVPGSALVCLSALYAAKQYSDVAPAAGALLALAATWNAVAAAAAADTWRLNNAVRAEPLYPHKVAGMRSQTRLTIEAFEGLSL